MGKAQLESWQRGARGVALAALGLPACGADASGVDGSRQHDRTSAQALTATVVAHCGAGALRCRRIARDDAELTIAAARPALNDGGLVAFAGEHGGVPSVLSGRGGGLSAIDVGALGLDVPVKVALDASSRVAWLAATAGTQAALGALASNRRGRRFSVHYAAEPGGGIGDGGSIISEEALALAPAGTLAFSSIDQRNGAPDSGALYRGPVRGSLTRVVSSSDVSRPNQFGFSNVGALDVSSAGSIAAQMQHVTRCGVQNGVLVFDTPEPTLAEVGHAITGLSPDLAPAVAIDESGVVVFALPGSQPSVMVLRCPPAGNFVTTLLTTGVYTAQPAAFSETPTLAPVADVSGGFAAFGAVDIAGSTVVFEATLDAGGSGVFRGPDPEQDAILRTGDELDGELVSEVRLGQLNHAGQLSLLIVGASGRSVWRVSGLAR